MGDDAPRCSGASDNLESLYARSALRQFYIALWWGHIEGWSLDRFEDATGLKLTYEGNLKENLPPMPQFLNRLLALPIAEQNVLFAALETRIRGQYRARHRGRHLRARRRDHHRRLALRRVARAGVRP